MKTCPKYEIPICDMCTHFKIHKFRQAMYPTDGWCSLHNTDQNVEDVCEDFHCYELKEEK